MAWEKSHRTIARDLTREQVWKVWADISQWHLWDTDIEFAKPEGPFVAGGRFILKPKGGPRVKIRLQSVEPLKAFTDVTTFPLARMYGIHEMCEKEDGLEVSHTVRVEGPLGFVWRKLVAENVAAGLEDQAKRMIERARQV